MPVVVVVVGCRRRRFVPPKSGQNMRCNADDDAIPSHIFAYSRFPQLRALSNGRLHTHTHTYTICEHARKRHSAHTPSARRCRRRREAKQLQFNCNATYTEHIMHTHCTHAHDSRLRCVVHGKVYMPGVCTHTRALDSALHYVIVYASSRVE